MPVQAAGFVPGSAQPTTLGTVEKWKSRQKTLYDVLLVHQFLSGKGDHVTGTHNH